jgi:cytidyltransferase-like protein
MKKKVVMTFGTFDVFHPGHRFYLAEARKLGDRLLVIVALDSTVEKIK